MNRISLEKISKIINSGLTPLRSNKEYWIDGNIPWVKTEQLGDKYIYDSNEKITNYALQNTSIKLNSPNTLSIAMYGEGKTRGSVSILKNETTTNQACCNIFIDEEKADFEFVYYNIKTQYNNLRNLSSGVRKNLNSRDIKNFEILLPNLQIQKSIAKVLSDLDSKIAINNKINAALEAMAKTLYDYWFVQFDFPDKNGKPYKSSEGKMIFNEELKREIPVGWESGTFETFSTIIGGSTPSKSITENFTKEVNMSWITPKDLSLNKGKKFITRGEWDVTNFGIKSASLKIMPKGTVLLSSRAPIGYLAISRKEVTTNQGFKSFVPKENYSSEFIYYSVKNQIPKIEAYSSGSTFKEVSLSVLKTIKISIPNKNILEKYYKISKPIFKEQNLLELENQKLSELRDWLLPMLMNGQVRVGEK
ncbi:restriction endonuclease subunit S [Tenacibaculum piscium]|uniref:restriction endonuclease subunit S n=1 Tax=Tenacibaculum piscium TaxID=1458515 RepID=UPI0023B89E83|nr:restriction endonuclease subunit S [Tenacibaculum piscium]